MSGTDLPEGLQVSVETDSGQIIVLSPSFNQLVYFAPLMPGTYTIIVGGWSQTQAASLSYQLTINFIGEQDNAPPLVDGPSPALQIQLEGVASSYGATFSSGSSGIGPVSTGAGGSGSSFGGIGSSDPGPGGSQADSTTGLSAFTLAQIQSASSLTGLGMGPLGGVDGGESDPASAAPIQVALGPPQPTSPVFSQLALNLVTLTQVISLPRDGEGNGPTQPVNNITMPALNPTWTPAVEASTAVETEAELSKPLLAAEASPSNNDRLSSVRELPVDRGQAAAPENALVSAGETFAPRVELVTMAIAPVDRDKNSIGTGTLVARLVISATIVTAAFRTRAVVRGLEWRKKGWGKTIRSEGPREPRPQYARMTHPKPGGGFANLVARRNRCKVQ